MPNLSPHSYIMPAEWEHHSAVWLAWPYDQITFGSLNQKDNKINTQRLLNVEKKFIEIINALQGSEKVKLITREKTTPLHVEGKVEIFESDYADVWTRDYMPSFIKDQDGKLRAVKWIYNAYGEKFKGLIKDNNVWSIVNEKLKITTIDAGIVMESGA